MCGDDTYCHSRGISQWDCLGQAVGGVLLGAENQELIKLFFLLNSKLDSDTAPGREPIAVVVDHLQQQLLPRNQDKPLNLNNQEMRYSPSGHLGRSIGIRLLIASHARHGHDAQGAGNGPLAGQLGPFQGSRHLHALLHLSSSPSPPPSCPPCGPPPPHLHLNASHPKSQGIHFTPATCHWCPCSSIA